MLLKNLDAEEKIVSILNHYLGKSEDYLKVINILFNAFSNDGKSMLRMIRKYKFGMEPLNLSDYKFKDYEKINNHEDGFSIELGAAVKFDYRLECLKPDGKIRHHKHTKGIEIRIIAENEVVYNGHVQARGDMIIIPPEKPYYFVNPFSSCAKMVCISIPRWNPENEVDILMPEAEDEAGI